MSAVPVYRLHGVVVEAAGKRILEVEDLEIASGQISAVVGPNGAGKTTLLRVLAFLQPPRGGRFEFEGRHVPAQAFGVLSTRRRVTLVGQSPLLLHRSVGENVAYGLRRRGIPLAGRVEAALDAVGLRAFADRPAWKLSGGEAQRVAIARALAIDPPTYLLDEPAANIDREVAHLLDALIRQLGVAGKTIVFTTHNLEQAYRLSESVVSLIGGQVAPVPPVNLLRGETCQIGGARFFCSEGLRIEIEGIASPRVVAIDPSDILISRGRFESSARNSFPGRVQKVEQDERGVMLTIDCGRPLVARITRHSYGELGVNVGVAVYATFKSAAVHVLENGDS